MKSVKEISHEIAWNSTKVSRLYDRDACRQEWCEIAAMSGANYVLEQIEPIIKADLGSYKSQLDRIKLIIEQLRK